MEGAGGNSTAPWRRQGSTGSGSGGSTPSTPAIASTTTPTGGNSPAPPPPPPPMMSTGCIPSVRLNSEVGQLQNKGPPMAIQGAMMKDKKPFTYTPGGINLSEIRSPRMAKRIQMNAAAEGVTSVPAQQSCQSSSPGPPHYLPPAALAAMQPQMPTPVFPQGGINPSHLNRSVKPTDFAPDQEIHHHNQFPPPPPQRFPIPDEPSHPTRPPPHPMQQHQFQQESRPISTNMNAQTQPIPLANVLIQSVRAPSGQQSETKAQTVSQSIGSIYIPPLEPKSTPDTGKKDSFEVETEKDRSSSNTPQTPQLNKAPTPWMNSHNKIQNQVQTSPPYVGNTATNTPWGALNSGPGRTIPIFIARDDRNDEIDNSQMTTRQQQNTGNRAIPFQIQMSNNVSGNLTSNGARTIPIQMEGNVQRPQPSSYQSTPQTPQSIGTSTPIRRMGPAPYNNPMNMYFPQAAQEAYKQMQVATDLQSGVNKMTIDEESPRQDPIQSKSFRVLQKITDDESHRAQEQRKLQMTAEDKLLMDTLKARVDEGSSLHNTTEPRFRGSSIPSRAFRTLQNNLPASPDIEEQPPSSSQPQRSGNPVTHTIKIRMPEDNSTNEQQQRIPASQQKVQEPKKYMGGNIPSRSFKILQAMTGEGEDQINALGSDVGPDQMNFSSSSEIPLDPNCSPNPETLSDLSLEYDSNNLGIPHEYYAPENFDPNFNWESWDAYMYWYYWWYYANYWNANNGAAEYPEGLENYVPSDEYSSTPPDICIPSKSFRNLQKTVDDISSNQNNEIPTHKNVPEIVIDGGGPTGCIRNGNKKVDCDHIGFKIDEKKDWDVILRKKHNETEGGRNDETEDESACECASPYSSCAVENEGYVDEPETPSSEDDASTLTDESQTEPVQIDESFSESESPFQSHLQDRLSTIDELSENELSSPNPYLKNNYINLLSEEDESSSESSSSSDEDNSSASVIENKSGECDGSGMTTTSNSKDKDDDNSSSNDEDVEVDEDIEEVDENVGVGKDVAEVDEDAEIDENENLAQSTVTVRLPLRLSFSKSKSYRDIATVLVGDSEIETDGKSSSTGSKKLLSEGKEQSEILSIRETSEPSEDSSDSLSSLESLPVVSYTITLSRSDSKNKETGDESTKCAEKVEEIDSKVEMEKFENENVSLDESQSKEIGLSTEAECTQAKAVQEEDEDVDFWGDIINKSCEEPPKLLPELKILGMDLETEALEDAGENVDKTTKSDDEIFVKTGAAASNTTKSIGYNESSVDFWQEIEREKDVKAINSKPPDVNFWEKQEIRTNRFNFIESHRNFELTEDYHREREEAMQLLISTESNDEILEVDDTHSLPCKSQPFFYLDETERLKEGREMYEFKNKVESQQIILDSDVENTECEKSERDLDDEGGGVTRSGNVGKGNEDEGDKSNEGYDGNNSSSRYPTEEEGRNSSSKSRKTPNGFRPIESPISLSVSDETSDESSSRSSGTTIGRQNKSENDPDPCEKHEETRSSTENNDRLKQSIVVTEVECKPQIHHVPIKKINDNLNSPCKHHSIDRVAKAEGLLWRIERFLQESLCLGSEDDSGFMTDLSRPISECETDYDAENETIVATQNKNTPCTICFETKISKERLSTSKTNLDTETNKSSEEKVTLRNSPGGRKSSSYQRAKTHSRLFQLLQDECGRDDDEEEYEEENDEDLQITQNKALQSSIDYVEKVVPIEIEASTEAKPLRNRLMTPLPIKINFPQVLDSNSTSSPSGSSGVLSPTSPAHRDQLLADIINEFHLRVNTDLSQETIKLRRNVNFPSKIFKLLQDEFGEEFYDTFHCGEDVLQFSQPLPLNTQRNVQNNTNTNSVELQVQECTPHNNKSESVTNVEKQSQSQQHCLSKNNSRKTKTNVQKKSTSTATVDHLKVPLKI